MNKQKYMEKVKKRLSFEESCVVELAGKLRVWLHSGSKMMWLKKWFQLPWL